MYINNTFHILKDDEEFAQIIGENCGSDCEEKILKLIQNADYTSRKCDSDLEAYEADNESLHCALRDISGLVYDMQEILKGRMNKVKLMELLDEIRIEIDNQI